MAKRKRKTGGGSRKRIVKDSWFRDAKPGETLQEYYARHLQQHREKPIVITLSTSLLEKLFNSAVKRGVFVDLSDTPEPKR